jgi:hypothetical protein
MRLTIRGTNLIRLHHTVIYQGLQDLFDSLRHFHIGRSADEQFMWKGKTNTDPFHFWSKLFKFLELKRVNTIVVAMVAQFMYGPVVYLIKVALMKENKSAMHVRARSPTVSWNISNNLTRFSSADNPLGAYIKVNVISYYQNSRLTIMCWWLE